MKNLSDHLHHNATTYQNGGIALISVAFLLIFIASQWNWSEDTGTLTIQDSCQRVITSPLHLVSVDCDVIVDDSLKKSNDSSLDIFLFKRVSINRANFELLQTVKGVGPKLAQQIIIQREQLGPFSGIESIQKLAGVGEKRAHYLASQFSFN